MRPPIPRPVPGERQPMPMGVTQARKLALGHGAAHLGQPSKMPGYSYGIDAFACLRGSRLAEIPGSVCAECYARKNFYSTWLPVRVSRERRQKAIEHERWCDAMVALIIHYTDPAGDYFRWHDSGDLMGVWHLRNVLEVCRRTPWVKHWLPTHESAMVAAYLRDGGEIPRNVCVRISADFVDCVTVDAELELVGIPTSTVHSTRGRPVAGVECRSYTRNAGTHGIGECGPCRACWNRKVANVSYPLH